MITVTPAVQHNWDWRAAGNFVCGGTGSGMLILVACAAWLDEPHYEAAAYTALAIVGLGLFLVWLEIGRPWRFANVFRNPATSWMSREAWAAALMFPFGALGAAMGSPLLISIAAALGLVFLFCQGQMLRAAKGIPAWRDAVVVPVIGATGLTEGGGLLLAATVVSGGTSDWLLITVLMLVVWRTVMMVVYAYRLRGPNLPRAARGRFRTVTSLVAIVGCVIPIALLITPAPNWAAALGGLLTAAGGWYFKYMLVCTLAYTQGFAIEHTPTRGMSPAGPGARPGWAR